MPGPATFQKDNLQVSSSATCLPRELFQPVRLDGPPCIRGDEISEYYKSRKRTFEERVEASRRPETERENPADGARVVATPSADLHLPLLAILPPWRLRRHGRKLRKYFSVPLLERRSVSRKCSLARDTTRYTGTFARFRYHYATGREKSVKGTWSFIEKWKESPRSLFLPD